MCGLTLSLQGTCIPRFSCQQYNQMLMKHSSQIYNLISKSHKVKDRLQMMVFRQAGVSPLTLAWK
jgi:hypothetical protein